MTSEGYWARFSRVSERSLNCLPHVRQRNRRSPWAVRSGRSVTASDPHSKHRILVRPLRERRPYTQSSPCRPEAPARALTEPVVIAQGGDIEVRNVTGPHEIGTLKLPQFLQAASGPQPQDRQPIIFVTKIAEGGSENQPQIVRCEGDAGWTTAFGCVRDGPLDRVGDRGVVFLREVEHRADKIQMLADGLDADLRPLLVRVFRHQLRPGELPILQVRDDAGSPEHRILEGDHMRLSDSLDGQITADGVAKAFEDDGVLSQEGG